jgi:glycosyltransferase involved in cell wall biosynthesis
MNIQVTDKPLVSIIVNCYNGDSYLKECIESIIAQTYQNWEVIFWDNRSEDKSAEIFKSYNDKRFKYFYADEHTSLYQARNLAIKETNGELIAFIDADDLWVKNKLEIQVKLFEDPKVALAYSNLWIIKNRSNNKKIFIKKNSPSGFVYNKLLDEYNVGIITVIFRKKILENLKKLFDERFSIIGDFDFFLRLSKLHYYKYTSNPLAIYRIHDKNFSSIYKEKEMEEFNIWSDENQKSISAEKISKIKKKISLRELLHYKFKKNYRACYKILIKNCKSIIFFKMLVIILLPLYILKKISRFHI